jgi:hypothetical protein
MDAIQNEAPPREPGDLAARLALGLAVLWAAAATAVGFALLAARLGSVSALEWAAFVGAVALPATMAVFASLAARDGARARAEAARLADAADRLLNPQMSASEAARRIAVNVRGEITLLDQALEQTLARLRDVEGHIARQTHAVAGIAERAKAGANEMITGMEREREELLRISRDLNSHAQAIGDSISRHTQAIAEAARNAETEVHAADQALDNRITSFGAAAALIGERTHGLAHAAQASADSAGRLEAALSNAMGILSKSTALTDAARQSADAAVSAASSTAGVVRESTDRALEDAKRAAAEIRGEAMSIEREASVALERLREAAEAAREAAAEARAAAEAHAAAEAQAIEAQAAAEARSAQSPPRGRMRRQSSYEVDDESWRDEPDPLETASAPRRPAPPSEDRPIPGDWTWRDLLSSADNPAPRERVQKRETAAVPAARASADGRGPQLPIIDALERAGIKLDIAFSASGLERIAQRARSGTQARRRAVQDAAPDAARKIAELLAADGDANQEAMQFLRTEGARIAELMGRGRAVMGADATRAFLLIDAAAG